MSVDSRKFTAVGLLCWAVPLTLNFVTGFEASARVEFSPIFTLFFALAPGLGFSWWMQRDNRLPELRGVLDVGYAVLLAWYLFVPYYLLRTRGVRALLIIGGFVGAYFCATFAGLFAGFLLVG